MTVFILSEILLPVESLGADWTLEVSFISVYILMLSEIALAGKLLLTVSTGEALLPRVGDDMTVKVRLLTEPLSTVQALEVTLI